MTAPQDGAPTTGGAPGADSEYAAAARRLMADQPLTGDQREALLGLLRVVDHMLRRDLAPIPVIATHRRALRLLAQEDKP